MARVEQGADDAVVTLSGRPFVDPRQPDPGVVSVFEDMLERARAGEIKAVVMAVEYFDDSVQWAKRGHTGYATLGAMNIAVSHLEDALKKDGF